jgi:Lar family restriction alleviation protein
MSQPDDQGTREITLPPCPFCGETPVANNYHTYTNQDGKFGGIACGNCSARGPEVATYYAPWEHWKWAAIKEWNTRASERET